MSSGFGHLAIVLSGKTVRQIHGAIYEQWADFGEAGEQANTLVRLTRCVY
jgi:hypothetical protein